MFWVILCGLLVGLKILVELRDPVCDWLDDRTLRRRKAEIDPVLPSQLDDWDAEFTRLTGKTIWQARCEADPNLCKSAMMPGTAQNNPNPFYGLQNQGQIDRVASQLHLQRLLLQQQTPGPTWDQLGQQGNQHNYQGLLVGLGNSLGGLFH